MPDDLGDFDPNRKGTPSALLSRAGLFEGKTGTVTVELTKNKDKWQFKVPITGIKGEDPKAVVNYYRSYCDADGNRLDTFDYMLTDLVRLGVPAETVKKMQGKDFDAVKMAKVISNKPAIFEGVEDNFKNRYSTKVKGLFSKEKLAEKQKLGLDSSPLSEAAQKQFDADKTKTASAKSTGGAAASTEPPKSPPPADPASDSDLDALINGA